MNKQQDYELEGTHIRATLEAVGPRMTRCTFYNCSHKVLVTVEQRLAACEISKCAKAANDMQQESDIMREVISKFPDWGLVLSADEDEWSPVD